MEIFSGISIRLQISLDIRFNYIINTARCKKKKSKKVHTGTIHS